MGPVESEGTRSGLDLLRLRDIGFFLFLIEKKTDP